jgi:HD-GYP domain-containing protein (c-di-GMP phosphodiesterase class II)
MLRGWTRRGVAAAAGIWLLAGAILLVEGLAIVQSPVADALIRLAANYPPAVPEGLPDVAIVALDPRSLAAFYGSWPWPRSRHAELIRRLDRAGARAIGFDLSFAAEQSADEDRALAQALRESGHVVLAAHRQFQDLPGLGELEVATLPLPLLAEAAAEVGAAMVEIEADGAIRGAFRIRAVAGTPRPSLAEATLALAAGSRPARDPEPSIRIDYRRARPEIPVISAIDVLEGRFEPDQIAGRAVLIGATAAEFQDLWTTPLGPNRAGVWIQAVLIRTLAAIRAGKPVLRDPSPVASLALLLALSLGAGLLAGAPHRRRLVSLGALALLLPSLAPICLVRFGTLVDPVLPFAVVSVHYVLGLESVRRHLGQRLREGERSLATLFEVGHAAARAGSASGLELALVHLADVVEARGVALWRTERSGELDPTRLQWSRDGRDVGHFDTAMLALSDRQLHVFDGGIPGGDCPGGQAVYTPLRVGASPEGVLVVERLHSRPLSEMQLRTIVTVGTQLALSVENLRLLDELRSTFVAAVESLATAVEARDGYTELHCRRLAAFSALMADRLGLPAEEVEAIRLGALLHDVGKLGIRDAVLLKDGRLSAEERRHIELHPEIGHRIVGRIMGLAPTTLGCVRHHHERWDGTGYPDGLAREEIPLGARIVAIVDVWDALSTARPYKAAFPQSRVREILEKDSGTRFEPALVDLFLELLDECGTEMLAMIDRTASTQGRTLA